MIPGPKITIGDRVFTVAPATLGAIKRQMKGYQDNAVGSAERIDVSLQFILETLQRNHPDLDMAYLEQWVDVRNSPEIMRTIGAAAGYEEKGEAVGEAQPAT
jgi:hypothetical protein